MEKIISNVFSHVLIVTRITPMKSVYAKHVALYFFQRKNFGTGLPASRRALMIFIMKVMGKRDASLHQIAVTRQAFVPYAKC